MIVAEDITINGKAYIRYTSDSGYYLQKVETGEVYSEAVDPADVTGRTYVETETLIEDEAEELSDSEALQIIIGGETE